MVIRTYDIIFISDKRKFQFSFWQAGFLGNISDYVAPKAVHAQIKPIIAYIGYFLTHLWIFPIEIGLFFRKQMQIPFSAALVVFPRRSDKVGSPIIGRLLAVLSSAFSPNIIISILAVFVSAFDKPSVFVRRMIDDQVHY